MAFHDLAKKRFSARKYKSTPVEEEKLLAVLEAGRIAPSAANRQPWKFFVVREAGLRERLNQAYRRDWMHAAPVLIVLCGDHSVSWKRLDGKDHCDVDIAIAADHMTLAAADLGLATCWICAFDAGICAAALELPDNLEPIVLLPLGYTDEAPDVNRHETRRKTPGEVIVWK